MNYLAVYECDLFRNPSGRPVCYIKNTAKNIAAFVASCESHKNYAFITPADTTLLFSMGNYLDLVPDEKFRQELLKEIIPFQMEAKEIPDVVFIDEEQINGMTMQM